MQWPTVLNLATCVSLLSLLITTYYYLNMLTLTKNLQRANTFNAIHVEYASQETLNALEILEEFIEENGRDRYPHEFLDLRKQRDALGRRVDRARRRLVHWYSRLQYFYQFGFLTIENLRQFPGVERAAHFIYLVEPLEFISRTSTGREQSTVFSWLRDIYHIDDHYKQHRLTSPTWNYTFIHTTVHSSIPNSPDYNPSAQWNGQPLPPGCSCMCAPQPHPTAGGGHGLPPLSMDHPHHLPPSGLVETVHPTANPPAPANHVPVYQSASSAASPHAGLHVQTGGSSGGGDHLHSHSHPHSAHPDLSRHAVNMSASSPSAKAEGSHGAEAGRKGDEPTTATTPPRADTTGAPPRQAAEQPSVHTEL
ncbi:unnamed protein product [Vitrella brassicaformis CCMP3155]|uniref:Uncharacterized protein n=2 Tax=Vitrella brassicaformis TaxID=1169539 RepID=A0A0G4H1S8_VITBC|nr:unnamed protein product [Vitrella brassicaformis CCMP3155]|eukprot:CEM37581.1 unnamed protein product [Vitrella brassicaformis CCMP3155]